MDIKHYIMSLREAIDATKTFGLDEKQIIEFDIKYSLNINCRLKYPAEADEINELQHFVFHRHCLDVHRQLMS